MASILDLPVEIHCRILSYCTKTIGLRLLRTCRRIRDILLDYKKWWRRLVESECKITLADSVEVDYPAYCAFKGIWMQNNSIRHYSMPATALSGIPGFTTIDEETTGGNDYGGSWLRHVPGGRDPFIHGILTDGSVKPHVDI